MNTRPPANKVVWRRIAEVIERIGHDSATEGKYVIRGRSLNDEDVDQFAEVFAEVSRLTGVPAPRVAEIAVWTNMRPVGQRGDAMFARTHRRWAE